MVDKKQDWDKIRKEAISKKVKYKPNAGVHTYTIPTPKPKKAKVERKK